MTRFGSQNELEATFATQSLVNGTIRTMDDDLPMARSMTIRGNIIADCSAQGASVAASADLVDLRGRTALPGFTDSHTHFPSWALSLREVVLDSVHSAADAVSKVAPYASFGQPGSWLRGYGWREGDWDDKTPPTRGQLDAVTGDRPVALWSKDYHSLWLNSAGLARAGRHDLAAHGGVVERLHDGSPSGVLREEAAWHFRDSFARPTEDELVDATRAGMAPAHAAGVTAIHDKDGWIDAISVFQRLNNDGDLTLRVWQSLPPDRLDALSAAGLRSGFGDAFLRLGYIKVFMDGTLSSNTAHRLDDCGCAAGIETTNRAELKDIVMRAAAAGFPLGIHAIGDLANKGALDVLEETAPVWQPSGLRQRIEHAQLLDLDDVPRFANLDVTISCQFAHAAHDRDLVDSAWGGSEKRTYMFRSLLEAGTRLCNGSDAPVFGLDPLEGLRAAVNRTLDGRPSWHAEQGITALDALQAMTVNPAWLAHDEARRGRLAPGMLADLVVLSRDPVTCPPDELSEVQVVATMVDGRWVHNPPPWD